ncbi:MAG TPA: DUF3231 family protein [Bacillota bacterium]
MNVSQREEMLHAGEVFHLWSYLAETKAYLVTLQVFINHTEDNDLKLLLEDFHENCLTDEHEQVEAIMKETGIRMPPAPPERPNVELQDIPAGARFHDPEIATLVRKELLNGRMICSYIIGIANHEDIRTLFEDFHTQKAEYEQKLLTITKEKGWYVSPPLNVK